MTTTKTQFQTDTWVTVTWDEYLQLCEDPIYEKAKFYYYNGRARIEMTPLGNPHASDHSILNHAIHLYASIKDIPLNGKDSCSYRKAGVREVQPDLSFYIGDNANAVPYETKIINLDLYPPPDLVIEVADTTIADDKGEKRLLYEDLGVKEYWIADVNNVDLVAFAIEKGGSRRITQSQVLPGLTISLLKEALRQTRQTNHSQVGRWLLQQFQQ